ncbi:unnamed protein product [Paramecium sonneborni]|uniref:Protein kinase domain-containing protein n=1 Tax=Paramecium sonneborni TaxID=65129 RepID=A0A8S1QXY1_9CILI|nr:unnamed protein product [Paramecium sonneborni]
MKNIQGVNLECVIIQGFNYLITKQLSKSDSEIIYKGQNSQTQKQVLIKVINITNQKQIQNYLLLAQKKCKNVMNIVNIEQKGELIFLAMEFSEKCLMTEQSEQIKKNERYIIKQIANGLLELHTLGISHQKISLKNIAIETLKDQQNNNNQQVYKICDYGDLLDEINLDDFYAGTNYQAPEQIYNESILTYQNKVDIWAFGIICYQLFNTKESYQPKANDQEEINQKIKALNCDPNFKNLFIQMLQINPEQRYNIQQVLNELKVKSQIQYKKQFRYKSITQGNQNHPKTEFFRVQYISLSGINLQSRNDFNKNQTQFVSNFNYAFSQEQIKKLNNS